MEKYLSDAIKYLTAFAVFSAALGLVIINLYLQKFSLVDFYIIKPQIIYVGFIFIVVLLANFVIYLLFLDLNNPEKTGYLRILGLSIIKLLVLGNTLNLFLNGDEINQLLISPSTSAFGRMFIGGSSIAGLFILTTSTLIYEFYIKNEMSKKIKILYIIIFFIFIIISIVGAFYCLNNIPSTRSVYSFEAYIGVLVTLGLLGYYARRLDQKKGFDTREVSFFSTDINGKKLFDKLFLYLYMLFTLIILLKSYSKNIYPLISPSYGGGRPQIIQLVNERDTINGEIIFQNSNYIFLKKDSSILKLDWKNVNSILLKTKKNEKNF